MKFGSRRLGGLLLAGLHGTTHDYGSRSQATHLCFWQRLPPVGAWCPLLVDFGLPELPTQLLASLHVSRIIQFAFLRPLLSETSTSVAHTNWNQGGTKWYQARIRNLDQCGTKWNQARNQAFFRPLLHETLIFVRTLSPIYITK